MAPVEQTSFPLSVASIGELKTVEKARELPVVKDVEKYTTDLANQISENAHVQSAKQIVESGIKCLSENETFSHFQGKVQELNENTKVKQTLDTVKEKVTGAVDHLDIMAAGVVGNLDTIAAGGLENLTAKLPALNTSTPELVETTKEVACSYASLATEYLSSFALSQIGLKLADRSLSMAEKTTKFFKADIKKDEESLLTLTYTKLRQTRRALRAIKRAGERKNHMEKDAIARTGLVGALASMLSLNTFLGLAGLEIVPEKKPVVEDVDTETEDGDESHREISDLKGDLDGYNSEEDPDYKPEEDSLISTDEESSGGESDEEADAEDLKTTASTDLKITVRTDLKTDANTDVKTDASTNVKTDGSTDVKTAASTDLKTTASTVLEEPVVSVKETIVALDLKSDAKAVNTVSTDLETDASTDLEELISPVSDDSKEAIEAFEY